MILAILASLGTTKLSAITLGIMLLWLCYIAIYRRRRITIPPVLWILITCVALSAVWSVNPGKPLWLCLHILIAYLAYRTLPHNHAKLGISLVAAIQIGVILWQYTATDLIRPNALSRNASVLGLAGMWMMPGLLPAIMVGLSISRTASLGVALFALTGRRYWIPAGIAISTFLIVTVLTNPNRLSIPILQRDVDLRVTAIQGTSIEVAPPVVTTTPVEYVKWRWYGYGWGQYALVTGRIQPHNIFVRTWYEMGVLTIPIGYCLMYLWLSRARYGSSWRNHDWRLLLVACATGMLTDELLGSVEGVYMMLTYCIINRPAQRLMRERVTAPTLST